jgi:hypothetical protein
MPYPPGPTGMAASTGDCMALTCLGSCLICQALNELDRHEWYRFSTTTELLVNGDTYCTIVTPHPDLASVEEPASGLGSARPLTAPRQEAFAAPHRDAGSASQVCPCCAGFESFHDQQEAC